MAWLKRIGHAIVAAVRWLLRNTRERLSPRGRVVFDWVAGLLLIAIGMIGGFVPILQGWVFVLAGLAILSKHSSLAQRWFKRVKLAGRHAKEKLRARGSREQDPSD
jgi:hypothetical protein